MALPSKRPSSDDKRGQTYITPPTFSTPGVKEPVGPPAHVSASGEVPAPSTTFIPVAEPETVEKYVPVTQQTPPQHQHVISNSTEANKFNEEEEEEEAFLDAEAERQRAIDNLSARSLASAALLLERIGDDECSEVLMNGPDKIMVKISGVRYFLKDIFFESIEEYHTVINLLILWETDNPGRIGATKDLIEGQMELPDYNDENGESTFARVHVIAPPTVKAATVTIAKKAKNRLRIDDFVNRQAMTPQMGEFIKGLARGKATVVFSGLSGAGKTTLLEASSYEFDTNDRVIVVEDTAELRLPIYDVVSLIAPSVKPGQDPNDIATLEWLVKQANRMRPDRIIVGESRGGEFAEFLTAANSGADGSMTTLHASSSRQTLDKMRSLALKAGNNATESTVNRDISSTVQIIIQMGLVDNTHKVLEITEVVTSATGERIVSQPIFEYNRSTGTHKVVGRPTEELKSFLAGRGVNLPPTLFNRI